MTYVISIGLNVGLKPMSQAQRTEFIKKTDELIMNQAETIFTRQAIGHGEWTNDQGETIREKSCTWVIWIENQARAQELATTLRPLTKEFDQDSIVLMTVSHSDFISA